MRRQCYRTQPLGGLAGLLNIDTREKYNALVNALAQYVENGHQIAEYEDVDPYVEIPDLRAAEELLEFLELQMLKAVGLVGR